MAKQRIKYIDVAKGILIVFVCLGHITGIAEEYGGVHHNYFSHTGFLLSKLYTPFYMQAFFFITGLTTNFDKPFVVFIKQNFKRLIIPYISFSILYALFNKFFFGHDLLFTEMDGENLFFLIESYWFLSVLFISKILFWFICKISNQIIELILCLVIFLIGLSFSAYYLKWNGTSHWHNYFHYRCALMILIFIWTGHFFKQHPSSVFTKIYATVLYMMILIGSYLFHYSLPSVGHNTTLAYHQIPFHILIATLGSFFVLYLSKILENNKYLQECGKQSLTIYTTHYLVLEVLAYTFGKICLPDGKIWGVMLYILFTSIALTCCYGVMKIFQRKPFIWMLGDF